MTLGRMVLLGPAPEWLLMFCVLPLAAYVIGSTPFGVIIARSKGIDLRAHGSGNVGATNVWRVVGWKWGCLCLLLDVGKGLVPMLAMGMYLRRAGALGPAEQLAWLAVATGAVLGHVLSFWLGFRGGKGVATSLGVVLGLWPYFTLPGLAALAVWIAVALLWRYVSLGSIAAAVAFPLLFLAACLLANWPIRRMLVLLTFAVVMALLVVWRHRSNISRLLKGAESKLWG